MLQEILRELARRPSNFFIVFFYGLVGFILVFMADEVVQTWAVINNSYFDSERFAAYRSVVRLGGFALLSVAIGFVGLKYLRSGTTLSVDGATLKSEHFELKTLPLESGELEQDVSQIREMIRAQSEALKLQSEILKQVISQVSAGNSRLEFTGDERKALVDAISGQVSQQASAEFIRAAEEKFGQGAKDREALQRIKNECERARRRLLDEVRSLTNRGNLNLVIGIAISLGGIGFLGWSVIFAPVLKAEGADLLIYFLPRTAFVLLIEVFAFFFLNLYRGSLQEIKYFQNELTNVEARIIGLETAVMAEDRNQLSLLAAELTKTERNFILAKGQTTVEIERNKVEAKSFSESLTLFQRFFDTQKNK